MERRADSHSKAERKGIEDSTAKAAEAAAEIRYLRLEVSRLQHQQSIIAKECKVRLGYKCRIVSKFINYGADVSVSHC